MGGTIPWHGVLTKYEGESSWVPALVSSGDTVCPVASCPRHHACLSMLPLLAGMFATEKRKETNTVHSQRSPVSSCLQQKWFSSWHGSVVLGSKRVNEFRKDFSKWPYTYGSMIRDRTVKPIQAARTDGAIGCFCGPYEELSGFTIWDQCVPWNSDLSPTYWLYTLRYFTLLCLSFPLYKVELIETSLGNNAYRIIMLTECF